MISGKQGDRLKINEVRVTVIPRGAVVLHIDCPSCLWKDVEHPHPLRTLDQDMDELNYEGSVELLCDVCKKTFMVFMTLEYVEDS